MADTFQVGDVVRLKSGGPAMTVHFVTDDAVECCWFTADGNLKNSGFEAETLVSADPPPADTLVSTGELGRLITVKRGERGVRAAAADAGVSPATLSRVENGHMPDLETYAKICRWLERDPTAE